VAVDIAYGGMWYAITDATKLGFRIEPDEARELATVGEKIRLAARAQLRVVHPENPDIAGVSIVQFDRPFAGVGQVTRNTCIVAPGRSDRSPTGTGTCARMAVLHARGDMRVGDSMVHESIIGSRFTGRIAGMAELAGQAHRRTRAPVPFFGLADRRLSHPALPTRSRPIELTRAPLQTDLPALLLCLVLGLPERGAGRGRHERALPYLMTPAGWPRTSRCGVMPSPGASDAVMKPSTRCGAPAAMATVP
jgi:Proline racemase